MPEQQDHPAPDTAPETEAMLASTPEEVVARLTLEDKASLTSGSSFWFTQAVPRAGIPEVMLTDGPHGVRKQREGGDQLGLADSVPATCFPPAVALGSTFDPELLEQLDLLPALVDATGFAVAKEPGYEADDFLGATDQRAAARGFFRERRDALAA